MSVAEVLKYRPAEQGTFALQLDFAAAAGTALPPNSAHWTLTDANGNIINGREDVEISTPAASENLVLSGLDLELDDPEDNVRVLLIKWTFSSDLGTDLPMHRQLCFEIENMVAI